MFTDFDEEGCNDAQHHFCMHPDDSPRPVFGRVHYILYEGGSVMIEKIFVIGCIVIVAGVCIWLGMYINSPSNQADGDRESKDAQRKRG